MSGGTDKPSRTQFTFYVSWLDGISFIKNKAARCDAYEAIIHYALDGILPDFGKISDAAAMAFTMAKPNIDVSRRNAENGKKPKRKPSETEAKAERDGSETEAKPKQERKASENRFLQKQEQEQVKEQVKEQVQVQEQAATRAREKLAASGIRFDDRVLAEAIRTYGEPKVYEAICEAAMKGGRTWIYVTRILADKKPNDQFLRHGQEVSPMMREQMRRMLEEEAAAPRDTSSAPAGHLPLEGKADGGGDG